MRGPWFAWNAMKKVPNRVPRTTAATDQARVSPTAGPMKPVTIVVTTKLPVNQNGPWCQTFPCRSFSGT